MPHFIIETVGTPDTPQDRQDLMRIVAETGAAQDTINPQDIKVRLYPCADALALDGRTSFIHVTARLLAGRTFAQKDALSCDLRDALAARWPEVQSISIEICDMDSESYRKRLI
ncbi:5-carboxymethyl-2-hydroxymuconate Delta-isomerase [Pseudosulfitobacter koreensis]|uniref:5-carboxymethyl-2-hydroxymuconate isomerase n=1 Tax=Pseudosulfitobacter koreensis TaxID=2968472 RepID=A0ABT1Z2X6_9RHOB|nr:hypothetical protein [Pseudosulfitobacter koreense]MCR8827484.1 hypothetical protein [Pseudosulfitobacter koreense]